MTDQNDNITKYGTYAEAFRALNEKYPNVPPEAMIGAFAKTTYANAFTVNPYIQNRRVKQISSLPVNYSKDKVGEMIQNPDGSEQGLRQISSALEYTAYPYYKLRKTYQDILSYHWYNSPAYLEENEAKTPEFRREFRLVDKICEKLKVSQSAHKIVGQVVRDGKAFYVLRHSVDKSHNQVNFAFMQQLPQDWVKIVGFNNVTGYTVAFNMMYFMQPGTAWEQFGDLFAPYITNFNAVASENSSAQRMKKIRWMQENGNLVDAYSQSGTWYYWVTLPPEAVWTFELDDVIRNVVTPFTGLFLSMAQIAQYEQVQLELVQNPLVAMVLGEIPYMNTDDPRTADPYKMSPTSRAYYEALFYQMLSANNTGGVGFYLAPAENLKLEQLSEAPSATEISGNGYAYAVLKSGNGLIPTTTEPRVGSIQTSAQIETRFAKLVYSQFSNMMNYLYQSLNLKFEWKFNMFGDIFSESEELKSCRDGMTLGILSDTQKYLAIKGMSLMDDLSVSNAVIGIGIMDKRLPLVSSYSAKQENGLPPQAGRPSAEGNVKTEGQENDVDDLGK